MNRVYLTGNITKISKVKLDISKKMQAVVIVEVMDLDNIENIFRIKLIDKMCEFCYLNLCVGQDVFIYGYCLGLGLLIANNVTVTS